MSTHKRIKVLRNKALKRHRRSLRSKQKARSKRKRGKERRIVQTALRSEISSYLAKVTLPPDFKFSSNRNGVLSKISEIESYLKKRSSTVVLLEDVKFIDIDAISLLLGIMAEFRARKIKFNGTFPKDPIIKSELIKSGFFEQLFPERRLITFGTKKEIFTHGSNILDQELTDEVISTSLKAVFGQKKRSQGVQRILIEAMKNTIQHADLAKNRRHWWLSVRELPDINKVIFSFLDYGIGIFQSLRSRDITDPGYTWFEKLAGLGTSNPRILRRIMDGELHNVSRTRKAQHGTGLPGMKTALVHNYVSKLVIMSNDVYADISQDDYSSLNANFSGTFIQFEVVKTCRSFDYE